MYPADADPELVAWIAADMASADPEIAIDAMAHSISKLRRRRRRAGAVDRTGRHHQSQPAAVPIAGVGHFPMLEDPAGFNRVLEETLATLPDSAG